MRMHTVTVDELCDILVRAQRLTDKQSVEIKVKADAQRARLLLRAGQGGRGKAGRSAISPAEIVASFDVRPMEDPSAEPLELDDIVRQLAAALGVAYEKIDPLKLDPQLITQTMSLPFARRTSVLPLREDGETLVVAVADPYDAQTLDELRRLTGRPLAVVLTSRVDIQRMLTEVYGFKHSVAKAAREMKPGIDLGNLEQLVKLKSIEQIEGNDRHVISAVEYILHFAFDQRASDIHIEPKREHSQIRMRIDGVLHDIYKIPKAVHPAIVTRIKTLTRLDLAERRRPQDGRFKTHKEAEEVEMRVSTLPVAFGEKVVIRIFDPSILFRELAELGFDDTSYERYVDFISRPNGLILVTGPTGSGKTTTLYSSLLALSSPDVNITTIEDPIEMVVEAFNQIAVHPRIGLDFASALRHVLRQDPDIVMVGEIRDRETASQALQAALTGHLVLSTLHTNDSATSVTRLLELELNPYLVSSTLIGVVAQRLLRKVCTNCRIETALTPEEMALLEIELPPGQEQTLRVARGEGCVRCRNTGLYGRTAAFELLRVNDTLRHLIQERGDAATILRAARADGTLTLREAAVRKLAQGLTSFDEVVRVTVGEDKRWI